MKKVIGIYCGNFTYSKGENWDSYVIRTQGAGGSETWAVEIAAAFQKMGFHVIVFGNPDFWKFDNDGVEYVPYYLFEHRCQYQQFDYFISSRRVDEITPYLECPNIYIISHEYGIFKEFWGNFVSFNELKMDKVKKIAVLSEWHKKATKELYPELKESQLMLTFNGIDQTLYKDINISNKKNMMVWSTCLNRGLTFFSEKVLPKILNEVPDFELNVCSYNTDIRGKLPKGNNVHFLGTLNKQELAELQKQAKIWILPNYGLNDFGEPLYESFCLTAVENAMSENAIICLNKGGLTTTLNGYSGIINADFFNEKSKTLSNDDYDYLAEVISKQAIMILKNENYRNMLGKEAKEICQKYTWKNSAKTWLKEWGLIYE